MYYFVMYYGRYSNYINIFYTDDDTELYILFYYKLWEEK